MWEQGEEDGECTAQMPVCIEETMKNKKAEKQPKENKRHSRTDDILEQRKKAEVITLSCKMKANHKGRSTASSVHMYEHGLEVTGVLLAGRMGCMKLYNYRGSRVRCMRS